MPGARSGTFAVVGRCMPVSISYSAPVAIAAGIAIPIVAIPIVAVAAVAIPVVAAFCGRGRQLETEGESTPIKRVQDHARNENRDCCYSAKGPHGCLSLGKKAS